MLSNMMRLSVRSVQTYGISYRCMASSQATDPIQRLFVDKIQEYNQKSKQTADGLVDATPKVLKELKEDMERVARSYHIKDDQNVANLGLKFDAQMKLDPINLKE